MPASSPILNPGVYLNYLPPSKAAQFEVSRDIHLITFGALVCDILVTLPDDLRIIKSGFQPTLIAYLFSRVSALILVLLSVIAKTKSIAHCAALELTIAIFWVIAVTSTSCLLLRRVHDVFYGRRLTRRFFVLIGMINIGVSFLMPIGSHAAPLAETGYCMNAATRHFTVVTAISRLIFDSCVYLGIVHRIATMEGISGEIVAWRTILTKKASSRLTRAFLKGGQQYYLMIVVSNILLVSFITSPQVPPMYKTMFPIVDIAFTTSMTCRVFRNLKIKSDNIDSVMSNMLFSRSRPAIYDADSRETETVTSSRHDSTPTTSYAPSQTVQSDPAKRVSFRLHEGGERYSIIKLKPSAAVLASTSADTIENPV